MAADSHPAADGPAPLDLFIIGGGINGTGIARDAAGRGLRVALCEQGDLAQGTSSRSSRLIHGGLRYLEYGEFRLVREALQERERLLQLAPHLVHPLRFVLPQVAQMRPAWMMRAGLFLYDHLARRQRLPASRAVVLAQVPEGATVRPSCRTGYIYADCRTDDARLVLANATSARAWGAHILPRTRVVAAARAGGLWRIQVRDQDALTPTVWHARALINAAGPWVEAIAPQLAGVARQRRARLIKGSHLVVRKFWLGDHAYLLQHVDRRAIFITPYEEDFALIGTTDVAYTGAPEAVAISPEETAYLLDAVNRQLRCALTPADVVHDFAGVRCLVDDASANPSAVTRDYVIEHCRAPEGAPALTILGGKITTFRRLAEQALDLLAPDFPAMGPAWTHRQALPGGDLPDADFARALDAFVRDTAYLPQDHARALFNRHGSGATALLAGIGRVAAMGRHFGAGLYECEVQHFVRNEWARSAQDVLWRRTKAGLRLDEKARQELARFLGDAGQTARGA